MAHSDKEIAECQERLAFLLADRDAENAALNTPRPSCLPPDWTPVALREGQARYIVVAWVAPGYNVTAYKKDRALPSATATPPSP